MYTKCLDSRLNSQYCSLFAAISGCINYPHRAKRAIFVLIYVKLIP